MQKSQRNSDREQAWQPVNGVRLKTRSQAMLLAAASSAILATALLSPSPVQASCAPTAASNVTASCTGTSKNLNGDNGYGTGTESNVTLTIDPGATLAGDQYGVALGANARITTGAGSRVEGTDVGILVNGDDARVGIAGHVTSDWVGVQIDRGSVMLSEGARIAVSNMTLADDELGAGVFVGDDGEVVVDGVIGTSGRLVYGVLVERQTPGSTRATRITVRESGLIDTGGEYASGIALFGGEESNAHHSVTVNGRVNTSGDHAYGIDVREVIDGNQALGSNTTTVMNGSVFTSGKAAHGIFSSVSQGSDSPITITGIVNTTGDAAHGIAAGVTSGGVANITVAAGGVVSVQGKESVGIAIAPSSEIPGIGTARIMVAEGGRVLSADNSTAPAIGMIDDPEMPVDPSVGRVNVDLTIAGRVNVGEGSKTAVQLGAGDDRVTLLPTYEVTGLIDGGTGFDTFVLDGAAGTSGQVNLVLSNGARVSGFEDIRKTGEGLWRLTGTVPSWIVLPAGTVEAGTLVFDAAASQLDLTVQSGATLSGSGKLRAVTVDNGGRLAPGNSPGVLSMETLTLGNTSVLDFELGAPGVASASDRIDVSGGLTLDGVLNVTDAGGFGNGVYTLINYGALVANNGLTVGTAPADHVYNLNAGTSTASAVTLEVTSGSAGTNQYWDGTNITPGNMQYGRGGAGIWNDASINWTNASGSANAVWGDQFAVFYNGTGDVTVEGEQTVTGLQFASDGYRLVAGEGGALTLAGANSRLRVDASHTAALALPVTVAADLTKEGGGRLGLRGSVGISSDLVVAEGAVQVEAGANVEAGDALLIGLNSGFAAETRVSGAGARLASRFSNVGHAGDGLLLVSDGGHVEMRENSLIGWDVGSVGAATVSGAGSRWSSGGYLAVGNRGDATLAVAEGGVVESLGSATSGSGGSRIARHAGSTGSARVTHAGSLWNAGEQLIVGYGGSGTLRVDDGGTVQARRIDIALESGSEGHLIIGREDTDAGVLRAEEIAFGAGTGTLSFERSDNAQTLAAGISGAGSIEMRGGMATLTGDSSTFAGTTTVHGGGTLLVGEDRGNGALGGLVVVKSGGTLGGLGRIGASGITTANGSVIHNVVEAGGTLSPGAGGLGALTLVGGWELQAGSRLQFQIGAPGTTASSGTSDRIIMADMISHLNLGGRPELHLFDEGGAGIGHYRIVTMNNAAMTKSPDGYFHIVPPASLSGMDYQVVNTWEPGGANYHLDLIIAPGGGVDPELGNPELQSWRDSGAVWTASGTDWRNSGGEADVAWAGNNGVFSGAGSVIAVEGEHGFKGLQFTSSGYSLGGAGRLRTVADGSELRVLGDVTATISAAITGSGGITKTQDGTVVLAGTNSYTGRTIIEAGTMALEGSGSIEASGGVHVGSSGAFDVKGLSSGTARIVSLSGSGIVSLGTTDLHVTQTEAGTFDGYMSGTGDFKLFGAATYTVTGGMSVGMTTVSTGATLQIGDGTVGQGGLVANDIHNAGTFVINRGDTGYWDGVLSGSGNLINRGPGTTIFAGESSLYTGAVDLEAGIFRLADGGVLGTSRLGVGNGATLGGTGRVSGNVFVGSGGKLAPGNSIGTFNITGDISFAAGSIYDIEIAANGDTDRVTATGAAALQGGTVQVTALDPHTSYMDGQTYTILSADGGVSGTFDGATMLNHSAFITPALNYGDDAVVMSIAVAREFETAAQTVNQRAAARGLFSFNQAAGSDALVAFNTIAGLGAEEARAAFDLASGEIHASTHYAIADAADLFTRTIQRRAGAMPAVQGRPAPWLAFLGQSGRHDADGNAGRLSSRAYGLAGGIDLVSRDLGGTGGVRFGLAAGYLDGRATVAVRRSKADYGSTLVGTYLSLSQGRMHLSNALSLGWHNLDTERRMAWGTLDRTARASRDARTIGYSGALRYDLPVGALRLSPLATLDIANVQFKRTQETGASSLALSLLRENFTAASIGVGAELGFGTQRFSGSVRVLYDHQIGDALPRQRAAFVGGDRGYTVLGPKMRDGGVAAGAVLAYQLSDRAKIIASYDGGFNRDANNHKGSVGLSIGF